MSQELFWEAKAKGFVRATTHTIMMIGFAGSGKTCTIYLLVNKDPPPGDSPPERTSQVCAEPPMQSLVILRAENVNNVWCPVQWSDLSQMVDEKSMSLQKSNTEKKPHQPKSSTQQSTSDHSQTSPPNPTRFPPSAHKRTQSQPSAAKIPRKTDIREEFVEKIDHDLVSHPKHLVLQPIQEVDWINFVDSSGYPQLYEALTTFLPEIAACFPVIKLSECLEDHPIVFLEKNDSSGSYRSPLSHLQMLQYCMRNVQSHMSEVGKSPLIAFIGTHKDLEKTCFESQGDKNRKLKEIIPSDKRRVLFRGEDELIVPFNTKKPGPSDKEKAGIVRSWVMEHSPAKPRDLPLQYCMLDGALQNMIKDAKKGVFAKVECQTAAKGLFSDAKSFEVALRYLARLKIILYYESILPDVVFCSPQVLLDKVSELVRFYNQCSADELVDGIERDFQERAIVTLDLLRKKRFSSHYVEGLFGPEELIQLLESDQLLLLAKVSKKEYLLPCVLPALEGNELYQFSPSPVSEFLIYFPSGGPQLGLFCRVIADLLKRARWKLLKRKEIPVEVKRNRIAFNLPCDDIPGRVTVCDSLSSFFLVSVSTRSSEFYDELRKICPRLRETILGSIHQVSGVLKYTNSIPKDAFFCLGKGDSCKSSRHPATLCQGVLRCTIDDEEGNKITENEQVWFQKQAVPDMPTVAVSPEFNFFNVTNYLLDLNKDQIYNLGISLGLSRANVKSNLDAARSNITFLDDIVELWLQRVDQVDECGGPSWKTLVDALRGRRLTMNGIADDIVKDLNL